MKLLRTLTFLIAGLILICYSLYEYEISNKEIKLGNCYDERNNIIIGQQCIVKQDSISLYVFFVLSMGSICMALTVMSGCDMGLFEKGGLF